jgi:hypothetical protein
MDFIKKNWEKVLLGVVLIGLAVAVAFLPLKIASEKADLEAKREILTPKPKPLEPVDLAGPELLLKRSTSPMALDFSTGHRLFNPVLWQKTPDGGKLKVQSGKEIGPDALFIVKTTPLFTILTLESVITNDSGFRYLIGLERQAADKPADRRKMTLPISKDTKAPMFSLAGVKEVPGSLPELTLELADSGERVLVTKAAPYKRVDGYLAELKYPPENRTWPPRRKDDKLSFGGADYNIVAIGETEVVVSAGSGKKTTVRMTDPAR